MACLLNKQLIITAGKGGVGRSSVAIALAIAAGRLEKKVGLIELSAGNEVAKSMGWPSRTYKPHRLSTGVDALSLSPIECLDDYGRTQLHIGALSRVLLKNRAMRAFIDAVPGFQDLVQLGKIEHLLDKAAKGGAQYDLLVVDGPATGHGLTLLSSARSMREMTKRGPFHDLAARVEKILADPSRCASVVVTLPEQLPVRETLEYIETADPTCTQIPAVIVNRVMRSPPIDTGSPLWERFEKEFALQHQTTRDSLPQSSVRLRRRAETQSTAISLLNSSLSQKPHHPETFFAPELSPALTPKETIFELANFFETSVMRS